MTRRWYAIENATTVWELVERRARPRPTPMLLDDGDDRSVTFGEFRDAGRAGRRGLPRAWASGRAPRSRGSCPTRIETIVRQLRPRPPRRRAEPDPPHLPGEGGRLRHRARPTPSSCSCPATWNGFDYEAMVERTRGRAGDRPHQCSSAYDALPEGDPATLPPPRPPTATRSAGSTTPRAPRRTRRACTTPTGP